MSNNSSFPPASPVTQQVIDAINSKVVTPFVDYASGPGTEPQAYAYIIAQLQIGDLRKAYVDLNIDLNPYFTNLTELTCPSGVTPGDWTTVQQGLESEIKAVLNVRALFKNNLTFINTVFFSEGLRVAYVGNMVQAESRDAVGASIIGILSDVLWAVSSVEQPVGAIINFTSAVFAAVATGVGGGVSDVQVAYAELIEALSAQFNNVIAANGECETILLTDWGKLQTINKLIVSGDLVWPPDDSAAVLAAGNAYEICLWQALLPLHYTAAASVWEHKKDNADYADFNCACICMQADGWAARYAFRYAGGYQAYWLLYYSMYWWDPPTEACNRLFKDLGVSKYDVVNSVGGWSKLVRGTAYEHEPSCVPKH